MYDRRWPLVIAVVVGVLVVGAIGWFAGHSSAPEGSAQARGDGITPSAIRMVEDVPVGVEHSRAGALAAADNYVAVGSETVVQDEKRYAHLVREAYAGEYQATALREARQARQRMTRLLAQYDAGRKALAVVAARRLDEYTPTTARVTTWSAGISWGPGRAAGQSWFLTEMRLRWTGDRWRVLGVDEADRSAPTPGAVRYTDEAALGRQAFERELEGMTAPTYAADG